VSDQMSECFTCAGVFVHACRVLAWVHTQPAGQCMLTQLLAPLEELARVRDVCRHAGRHGAVWVGREAWRRIARLMLDVFLDGGQHEGCAVGGRENGKNGSIDVIDTVRKGRVE